MSYGQCNQSVAAQRFGHASCYLVGRKGVMPAIRARLALTRPSVSADKF